MIRFICKSENNVEKNQERTNEFILRNKKIINGESEDLYPVLDIYIVINNTIYLKKQKQEG